MEIITSTDALKTFCKTLEKEPYIACDTEFLRETTYYPKLCLIQVAAKDLAAIIDPLSKDIDLAPLFEIFQNENIVKIFHASTQDLEIIYQHSGNVPKPVFDTQVVSMVCGYGDSVSYAVLVKRLLDIEIDKRHQYTDWSQRPLDKGQLEYAISDVTHLYKIYSMLRDKLQKEGRDGWVREELVSLEDPANYEPNEERLWQRIKVKNSSPKALNIVRSLVCWREELAKRLNRPRGFIMKDSVISDIASVMPQKPSDFKRIRSLKTSHAWSEAEVLKVVSEALAMPKERLPNPEPRLVLNAKQKLLYDALKLLLKVQAGRHNIAERLIATADDIKTIVTKESPNVSALQGWRRQIFGEDALLLKQGEIFLKVVDGQVKFIRS